MQELSTQLLWEMAGHAYRIRCSVGGDGISWKLSTFMTKNVIGDDMKLNLWEMGYKNKFWMEQTHNICLLARFLYCNIEPSGSVKIIVTYNVSYN